MTQPKPKFPFLLSLMNAGYAPYDAYELPKALSSVLDSIQSERDKEDQEARRKRISELGLTGDGTES